MVRDFEVDSVKPVQQLPTNIPVEHSEIVGLNKMTNLGPGEITKVQAEVKVLHQSSAITEEIVATESEERSAFNISKQERKVSTTTSPLESLEISEIEPKESLAEMLPLKPEPTQQIRTDFVPNQSVIITESNTTDTVGDFVSTKSIETKASVEFSVHDAKVVSEAVVSHQEKEMESKSQPTKLVATEDIMPVESIEITEVQKAETEKNLPTTLKTQTSQATRTIPESEYMEVTEIFSEDKPSKYYPELVVATEIATKSVVTQKPYVTQETNAPEKEDLYIPGRLPPQQLANVSLQSVEPISVTEAIVQDAEKEFTGTFIPESMSVNQEFRTYESVSTSVVDCHQNEITFEKIAVDEKTANVDYSEHLTVSTSVINVAESEEKLLTPTEVKQIQPNFNFSSMPISDVSQPLIHEHEDDFIALKQPNAQIGKSVIEPTDAFQTQDIYPISGTLPFEGKPEVKGTEATLSYELQESTEVTTTVSNDKEADFVPKPLTESTTAATVVDTQRSIQVTSQVTSEREEIFRAPEMLDSHQATVNPTHALKSIVIEQIDISDSVDKVAPNEPGTTNAKVVSTQMNEMMTSEVTPFEGLSDLKHKVAPESYFADTSVYTQKYVEVTEQMPSEKEEFLKADEITESQNAKTAPSDTFKSIVVEEIQSTMSTDDVKPENVPLTKAKLVSDEMEEKQISETTAFEDVASMKPTEKPEAYVATKSLDLQKSIQVTVPQTSEKEDKFEKKESFDGQIARQAPTQPFSSLIVEEVEPLHVTGDVIRTEPVTSSAKVKSIEKEEMIVSEVQPFDGVADLKPKESPEEFSAVAVLDVRKPIEVTLQIPSEHEKNFDSGDVETQTAKPATVDTHKSIVIEEVEPSMNTDVVKHKDILQTTAKVINSEMEVKQISEIVAFEGITQLEVKDKLTENVATEILDEMRSIQVSEQKAAEKEDFFSTAKPFVEQNAKTIPSHSLKSVQVEEVEPLGSVSDVKPADKISSVAKATIDEQQSSTISELVSYEGISAMKDLNMPETVTALQSLNMQQSVQVSSQVLGDKEDKLMERIPAEEQKADIVAPHALKSVMVEQIEPSDSISNYDGTTSLSTKAKIGSSHAEETTITETIPFEGICDLKIPGALDVKTATHSLNELRSLTVISTDVSDKEDVFTATKIESYRADVAESDSKKSMLVEETKIIESVGPLDEKPQAIDQAKIVSQDHHEMSIADLITYENTSDFTQSLKPDEKIAETVQDSRQSVIVECTQASEHETQFIEKTLKDEHAHAVPGYPYKAAVIEETEIKDSTQEYNVENISSHAEIKTSEHHEMTTSETNAYESTAGTVTQQETVTKTATSVIDERSPIQISSNEAIEREKEFATKPEFETQKAKSVGPSALTTAVSEEIESAYALDELKHSDKKLETATMQREHMEIAHTFQTLPCDTVTSYGGTIRPEEKLAQTSHDERLSVQISEATTFENERDLLPSISENKKATYASDDVFKSVIVQEITTSDSIKPIKKDESKAITGQLVADQLEVTKVAEITPYESVTDTESPIIDAKIANQTIISELKSVLTTETSTNECESDLQPKDNSVFIANRTISAKHVPTQEEVIPIDAMTPLKILKEDVQHSQISHTLCESMATEEVKVGETVEEYMVEELLGTKRAVTEYDEHKAVEQTDVKVIETTKHLNTFKPDDKIARLLQQASDALSVQLVASEIKEEELTLESTDTKTATKTISEVEAAETSEIITSNTVRPLEILQPLLDDGVKSETIVERKLPVKEVIETQETAKTLPQESKKSEKAKPNVKKIKVPLTTEIKSETSIEPLLQKEIVQEHATEHNVMTFSKTTETTEVSVNETTDTLEKPIKKTRRASQTIDTLNTSTVEVVTSNDTVQTLDIQQTIREKHSEITQQESMNILQITEVTANELTGDFSQKSIDSHHFAHTSETENKEIAKSKQPKVLRGR